MLKFDFGIEGLQLLHQTTTVLSSILLCTLTLLQIIRVWLYFLYPPDNILKMYILKRIALFSNVCIDRPLIYSFIVLFLYQGNLEIENGRTAVIYHTLMQILYFDDVTKAIPSFHIILLTILYPYKSTEKIGICLFSSKSVE